MKKSPPPSPFRAYGPFCRAAVAFAVVAVLMGASLNGQGRDSQDASSSQDASRAAEADSDSLTTQDPMADSNGLADKLATEDFSVKDVATAQQFGQTPVSYTHLTLPTILLV